MGASEERIRSNSWQAIRPDCKKRFVYLARVSNADIAPTIAQLFGFKIAAKGELKGRVRRETLAGGPAAISFVRRTAISQGAPNGKTTIQMYQ